MRNRSFIIQIFMLNLIILFLFSISVFGSEILTRKYEGQIDNMITQHLSMMPADINPSLPAPSLFPEPEYTWGFTNTIYWNRDSIETIVNDLNMDLLFFEVMATFHDTVLWAFPKASADSATFTNDPNGLPEGIPIDYQLRYYAKVR